MRRVLQYILGELKQGRLSKPGAVELTREIRDGILDNSSALHRQLRRDETDLSAQRFVTRIDGDDPCLRAVNGLRVLPDLAHLDIAQAALEAAAGVRRDAEMQLEQVEWLRPVLVGPD